MCYTYQYCKDEENTSSCEMHEGKEINMDQNNNGNSNKPQNDKNGRKKRAKILNALRTPDSARLILEELFLKNENKKTAF